MNVSNEFKSIIAKLSPKDVIQATDRSTVWRIDDYIVKAKVITQRPELLRFQLEVDIHKFLASNEETRPYVAGYVGSHIVESHETDDGVEIPTTGYYIQENVRGLDLEKYLNQTKNPADAKQLCATLQKGLDTLHKHVLHNDIKPENIVVVSPSDVKFIDFESACMIHVTGGYSSCSLQNKIGSPWGWGTPQYYPINIAEGLRKRKPYDILMDRYALGKVLLHVIAGGDSADMERIFREYMEPVLRTNTHDFIYEDIQGNTLVATELERMRRNFGIQRNTRKSSKSKTKSKSKSKSKSKTRSKSKSSEK